jgi:hypothetical protein
LVHLHRIDVQKKRAASIFKVHSPSLMMHVPSKRQQRSTRPYHVTSLKTGIFIFMFSHFPLWVVSSCCHAKDYYTPARCNVVLQTEGQVKFDSTSLAPTQANLCSVLTEDL